MDIKQLDELLRSLRGKVLKDLVFDPDYELLVLEFPEGKFVYIRGNNLTFDLEAAN